MQTCYGDQLVPSFELPYSGQQVGMQLSNFISVFACICILNLVTHFKNTAQIIVVQFMLFTLYNTLFRNICFKQAFFSFVITFGF